LQGHLFPFATKSIKASKIRDKIRIYQIPEAPPPDVSRSEKGAARRFGSKKRTKSQKNP